MDSMEVAMGLIAGAGDSRSSCMEAICDARPEETLYVGDTVWDMDCAASAGASGCAALWGALDKEIKAPFCASSPKELLYVVS